MGGDTHAHDTAVALRVLDLRAMYGPKAIITAEQKGGNKKGPDLVCWNCAQIASGNKVREVWVWEFKSANQSAASARESLESGMAVAAADPMRLGRTVKAGPSFAGPRTSVVPNTPNQVVTVYSDQTRNPKENGLEWYTVEDEGMPVSRKDPRWAEGQAAAEAAAIANYASNKHRQRLAADKPVQDDPVTGWAIAGGFGVIAAGACAIGGCAGFLSGLIGAAAKGSRSTPGKKGDYELVG
ncbi:hypothetical protein [Micromonospora sp. NPDC006431]|uniref:hypothetical protein n=1 Tax=Micromonospora sp. NPDC006431 TaxID=3364235 RepID=UPI0036822F73